MHMTGVGGPLGFFFALNTPFPPIFGGDKRERQYPSWTFILVIIPPYIQLSSIITKKTLLLFITFSLDFLLSRSQLSRHEVKGTFLLRSTRALPPLPFSLVRIGSTHDLTSFSIVFFFISCNLISIETRSLG